MNLAFLQARKIVGNTGTNPAVGCVVVKNGCVISSGHTSFNGRPHAEANALISRNKEKLKSSTIYVSLEPCSHQGKTPSCSKKIVKFSPKKVFYPILDYDFRSKGKCKNILKSYKIGVKIFKKYKFGQDFYKYYKNFKEKKIPYLSCKMAISKDFYTKSKIDRWITNQSSRGRVHLLRSQHDCILTSSKTINDDDPSLNCRIRGLEKHSPTRIILDRNLNISLKSKVIKKSIKYQTYIFYNKVKKNKIKLLKRKKIKLIYIALNQYNYFNLPEVLVKIQRLGFSRILLEAGTSLSQSFLKNNLVSDLHIFVSQNVLGKNGSKAFRYNRDLNIFSKSNLNNVHLYGDKFYTYRSK